MKVTFTSDRNLLLRASLLVAAGMCGLAGLVLDVGYLAGHGPRLVVRLLNLGAVGLFLTELIVAAVTLSRREFLRRRWPALALTVLLALEIALVTVWQDAEWARRAADLVQARSLTRIYLILAQFTVLGLLLVNLASLHARAARLRIRPGLAALLIFATLILTGAGLLMLPRATPPDQPLSFLDALFTSTSAVCVTGLIVRDTATAFTPVGQSIILVLIQLGGLGIMSISASLGLLLGRGIGVRESRLLREVIQVPLLHDVGRMLRFIALWTFGAEIVGVAALYGTLEPVVPDGGERLYHAVFLSVSAFCNAGFSTFSDSLVTAGTSPTLMVVALLLILGGLGFAVVSDVANWTAHRLAAWRERRPRPRARIAMQTRVVLGGTVLLLGLGTVLLARLDWGGVLAGRSAGDRLLHAFFEAATCRTAGFNSVDTAAWSTSALFLMMLLMFVGAGPGSTAGGVKLTTVAVLWADLKATAGGLRQVRLRDREIGEQLVRRAAVVLAMGGLLAALGTFSLLLTEGTDLLTAAFEAVSALGTVGLSLGLTGGLTAAGKVTVIVLMFVGRLGILTLAYGLVRPGRDRAVRLPRADMMIG